MKKITLLLVTCMLSFVAIGQTINYKILQDDPQNYQPKLSVNLMLLGIDMGVKNLAGVNFYTGLYGHYMINDRLGIQYNATTAWFSLGKLGFKDYPTSNELNAGAVMFLSKSEKKKNLKVILKSTSGTTADGRNFTRTTYVMVPGTRDVYLGVRGGLYYKSGGYDVSQGDITALKDQDLTNASLKSAGVYAGVIRRGYTNIIIKDKEYGKSMNSLGVDVYFDVMIVPVNSFTLLNAPEYATSYKQGDKITDEVNKYQKSSPIGFRLGWTGFQVAPKNVTGKRFGMSYNFEGGLLPYQGWFVKGGIGITLYKKTKAPETAVTPN